MNVKLKGNDLIVTIPAVTKDLKKSKSGKTLTVAKTGGFQETDLLIDGKPVYVNLNAYIHTKEKDNE